MFQVEHCIANQSDNKLAILLSSPPIWLNAPNDPDCHILKTYAW